MRVLHVFNEFRFSGAEIMYANAAPLFQSEGIEMLALSTGKEIGDFSSRFEDVNIQIRFLPLVEAENNPFTLIRHFRKIFKFLKDERIDVIHIHRNKFFWWFSLVGHIAGIKTISTVHNVFKHRKFTWVKGYLERFTARNWFKLTFQTIGKSVYENELYYYKNPSIVVNNWYDDQRFYPAVNANEKILLRERLGIPDDAFVIISTGGCSDVKNHSAIIEALASINNTIYCVYLHLGQGDKEAAEKELAKTLGVYEKIHFLGNRKNVREYLITADVYVMPSQFEGLSIAAIEAMACGIPSILYDSPGLRDLIDNNDNGLLIEPNIQTLAQAIDTLYNDRILAAEMGQRAQDYARKRYSVIKGVKGILKLYNS